MPLGAALRGMNILVIDVGGTHVKILATGQKVKREMASGSVSFARAATTSGRRSGGSRINSCDALARSEYESA